MQGVRGKQAERKETYAVREESDLRDGISQKLERDSEGNFAIFEKGVGEEELADWECRLGFGEDLVGLSFGCGLLFFYCEHGGRVRGESNCDGRDQWKYLVLN